MLNVTIQSTAKPAAFPVAWILSSLDGYKQETRLTLCAGCPLTFSFSCLEPSPFLPSSSMIYFPLGAASSATAVLGLLIRLQAGAA